MAQPLLAASSKLAELPDRLIVIQARTAVTLGRVPKLDRLPLAARARLAQLGGGALLLTIGTLIGNPLVWALLAVPLVAIVMLILLEIDERRRVAIREPRDPVGVSWVSRSFDGAPTDRRARGSPPGSGATPPRARRALSAATYRHLIEQPIGSVCEFATARPASTSSSAARSHRASSASSPWSASGAPW